ncbi:hypothetical protein Tco_0012948 [Tanacetum coccineum]
MEYLPQRRWSSLENKRANIMIKAIDKQLKERRMMKSLEKSKSENKGRVPTEMELVLEQTQQGTSYEVSVSDEGVEELKRKVKIKGEKKEALLTLSFGTIGIHGRKAHLLEDKKIPSVGVFDEVFSALGWHLEEIHRGDGVTGIKRRRRDLSSDSVMNFTTASGRNRLKPNLEDSTCSKIEISPTDACLSPLLVLRCCASPHPNVVVTLTPASPLAHTKLYTLRAPKHTVMSVKVDPCFLCHEIESPESGCLCQKLQDTDSALKDSLFLDACNTAPVCKTNIDLSLS